MLEAIVTDGGQSNVSAIARAVAIPVATAHRQVATLVDEGFLRRAAKGRLVAGPKLLGMLHLLDEKQMIANAAAPLLHSLAGELRSVVQLGTFENDMVTYRIKSGRGAKTLFTKVGMQLEAYCSGIGKVLLAHLPREEMRTYLASGPFVALTSKTITDPACLEVELSHVRARGFAVDDGEIAENLHCVAVPVRSLSGSVAAAISVSRNGPVQATADLEALVVRLQDVARRIEQAL